MVAIDVDSIDKYFGRGRKRTQALQAVSLGVEEGEAFGFIGANGAGKSTTIKILMGMMRPDGGEARFFGVSCADPDARRGVGYVPENPYLYDYLTPLEVLRMGVRQHRQREPTLRRWRRCLRQTAGKRRDEGKHGTGRLCQVDGAIAAIGNGTGNGKWNLQFAQRFGQALHRCVNR